MKTPTVLIIGDHADLLELIGRYLTLCGWAVTPAQNEPECRQRLAAARPDVIFMDARRPDGEIVELIRSIRETRAGHGIPILVAIGRSSERAVSRCLQAGCDEVVAKPFHLEDLRRRIVATLSGREASRSGPETLEISAHSLRSADSESPIRRPSAR